MNTEVAVVRYEYLTYHAIFKGHKHIYVQMIQMYVFPISVLLATYLKGDHLYSEHSIYH